MGYTVWGSPQVFIGQLQGEIEVLEDIEITSLSKAELARKRLYSENSGTETETGEAARDKSRPAVKRSKAPTLTSARAALRERVKRDREDGFEAVLQKRVFSKQKEVGVTWTRPIELDDLKKRGPEELMVAAKANLNVILGLTGKWNNLRGAYYAVKIRRAAGSIWEMLESLVVRTETEEV
ncbi:unnamed protein product [Euphydryas editha]|uniref:Reverse transcriptase n=1 Tax=Euphydryas editha TaxID=104508 RepID=A0AAU9TXG4_EUPED|nr:unnamed protein product [Euphydryas editha]